MWQEPEKLLPVVSAPEVLFRIGRIADPWRASFASSDPDSEYSGNRFDDHERRYGVLYASSSRLGCFIETLDVFRHSMTPDAARHFQSPPPKACAQFEAEIDEIIDHEPPGPRIAKGMVPASWLSARQIGTISVTGKRFADVCDSQWIAFLRRELEFPLSEILPNKKFDLSDVMARDRRVSQRASNRIHALALADGICYPSRHGHDLHNWAIFQPFDLKIVSEPELIQDDADFRDALSRLDLAFDPAS